MDILSNTKKFLTAIALLSLFLGIFWSGNSGWPSILGTAAGLLIVPILLAAVPLAVSKLRGKNMDAEQFNTTILVAWLLVAISKFVVG